MTAEPLLTAADVMAELKCSRAFLTAHAASMGAEKLGGLWRISRENLEAWRARHRMTAPRAAPEPRPTPIRVRVVGTGTNPVTGRAYGEAVR